MAGAKRTPRKARKPLGVKKSRLRDLPAKKKDADIKGGMAPPYTPVGPGSKNY